MARIRQKIGIFTASQPSAWVSCNSILTNFEKSYQIIAKKRKIEWLTVCEESAHLDSHIGTGYFIDLAEKILKTDMTDFVFLDHQVDPLPILTALSICGGTEFKKYRFCFHLYGDFTIFPQRWFEIGKLLCGSQAKFICASDRQKNLVSFFENKGQSAAKLCPFPVNTKLFRFSEKLRSEVRAKLKIKSNQQLLLYTGRLSLQKNILRLLEEFEHLCQSYPHIRLALAGPHDDIGGMTCGIEAPPGFYFHELQSKLRAMNPKIREKIFWLGDLKHSELKKIYSAADLFVSFSLYHDEDFGMCPAEAFSSGLPAVLNDWGGYASFKRDGVPCELIPVQLNRRGLAMDREKMLELLERGIQSRLSPKQRVDSGGKFEEQFGIAAIAKILDGELEPDNFAVIQGFDWALETYGETKVLKGGLYDNVYGRYVESPSN